MQIRFHCPTESCVAIIELDDIENAGSTITCPRCQVEHAVNIDAAIRQEHTVRVCPLCGCSELFVRKDFPQGVGLAVVVVAAAISLFFLKNNPPVAYAVLLAAVLVDMVIYLLIGKVTTCYACRGEFRGGQLLPEHEVFDLAKSEKY
jgi:hypothetical protein